MLDAWSVTTGVVSVVSESKGQFVPLIFGRTFCPPETDDQRRPRVARDVHDHGPQLHDDNVVVGVVTGSSPTTEQRTPHEGVVGHHRPKGFVVFTTDFSATLTSENAVSHGKYVAVMRKRTHMNT